MFNKVLDHLEEWLISFLMAAATLIIFVAVVHRYLAGVPYIQDYVLKLDLSWAQTLCTILFVWMCKFGAAYGVRTGIHVGVDVVINRMSPKNHGRFVIFGLSAGALFTGVIAVLGAVFVWKNGAHHAFLDLIGQPNDDVPEGPTDPDLEWPTWIIYLAIPLGSALMSYRFVQVCIAFWKTGELPKHDESHVEGIEEQTPLQVEQEDKK